MTRKIKALGLALVASLAMSALVASAAQAEFHSTTAHTILIGNQTTTHKFTVGSGFGAITCKKAEFTGTSTVTTETSQVITPHYKECTDSFGRTAHVTVSAGTVFRFTTPVKTTEAAEVHFEGTITIEVTNGSGVVICDVHITSQTNNNIIYHNVASGVEVTTNTTNVATTTSGGSLNCGVSDGAHTGGSYTGNTLTKGTDTEGKAVTITVTP
ncbi:MAG TPA: hypothetical protein VKA35_00185 [Solirubrobacterales bacterium]|nr:hypothetical protein [Solirubrobacterales bacterium]